MNSDTITATTDNQQTYILVTEPLISRHANGQETEPVHSTSHLRYIHIKNLHTYPLGTAVLSSSNKLSTEGRTLVSWLLDLVAITAAGEPFTRLVST